MSNPSYGNKSQESGFKYFDSSVLTKGYFGSRIDKIKMKFSTILDSRKFSESYLTQS